ncbi:unnamed protein product [Calicophoron daubneyi]|uniref:C-type lectin domain-containing protein n=1 Tax=Calicophoron daubneyi TaxID=300641 RepID=A0AAV2TJI6_CALDB
MSMRWLDVLLQVLIIAVANAQWLQHSPFFSSLMGTRPVFFQQRSWSTRRGEFIHPAAQDHQVEVKHVVTATYKGLHYTMVRNLSLGFEQAEKYCQTQFPGQMHLASVQSEQEWNMLANVFGKSYPREIWLGGTIERPTSRLFSAHWLNGRPLNYHRFSPTEQRRWRSSWRVNSQGCIVANLISNHFGNWSAVLAPCAEPREFICKETPSYSPSSSVEEFMSPSPWYGLGRILDEFFQAPVPVARINSPNTFGLPSNLLRPHAEDVYKASIDGMKNPQESKNQQSASTSSPLNGREKGYRQTQGVTMSEENTKKSGTPGANVISSPIANKTVGTPALTKTTAVPLKEPQEYRISPAVTELPRATIAPATPHSIQTDKAKTSLPNMPKFQIIRKIPGSVHRRLMSSMNVPAVTSVVPNTLMPATRGIAAQILYPRSVWDLTYPVDPTWLVEQPSKE